ncbi:MAG: methionyl-tRNA formyltransferase [Puniceicoccales bacterium]|jgi:methionyl-tRNA formyltransferase|nr:methionyl-tRNA formyltransferase [Puniceicoccales bacterium]
MKNIVYLGSDGIGLPVLQWLASRKSEIFRLAGVISGQDQRRGRGMKLVANDIAAWARGSGTPLLQPAHPKKEILPWMTFIGGDMGVVFAYGHILPENLLASIPLGFLNLHASLLPELRGPCPIEAAIVERKVRTGMTLMQLVKEMDAGPIYGSMDIPLDATETAPALRKKMSEIAIPLMEKYFSNIVLGREKPTLQDHSLATYVHMLKKSDGLIDFSKSAEDLDAQIRAYVTWPRCYFPMNGLEIKVGRTQWRPWKSGDEKNPGLVLGINGDAIEIATGDGVLRCLELQWPTKKMLPAAGMAQHFPPGSNLS